MRIKYLENKVDPRVQNFNQLIQEKFPKLLREKNPELFLVAGGDGAMLHAIHQNINEGIPFLGKAMGTLNFLMNQFENDTETIQKLLNDQQEISCFSSNAIEVSMNGKKLGEAVNDVILGDKLTNYFSYTISTELGDFDNFEIKGSGICISTVIGSTAFNYNNNGQILPLNSGLLSITGVVSNRYLNDIIPIQEITIQGSGGNIYLSNINSAKFKKDDILTLRKGSEIQLAFLDKGEFLKRRIDIANRYRK